MSALALKDARIELKTTSEAKEFLRKAAALENMDLASFMIACAMVRARSIIHEHEFITLSTEGQARLVNLLNSQPRPNAAMEELRKTVPNNPDKLGHA